MVYCFYEPLSFCGKKLFFWGVIRTVILNVVTFEFFLLHNLPFQGDLYTDFIKDHEKELFEEERLSENDLCDAITAYYLLTKPLYSSKNNPFLINDYFR